MAKITEKDLSVDLKRSHFERVYLFYGEESYLCRIYTDLIVKKGVTDMAELNLHKFSAGSSIEDIMFAVGAPPMLSERTVVTVCDFKFNSLSPSAKQNFVEFLGDLPDFCSLVFWYDRENFEPSKNKEVLSALEKAGVSVDFPRKGEAELTKIVCSRCAKRGVNMQPTVARYMLSLCSDDLENIITETDKVCDFVGEKPVTTADIDEVVSVSNEVSIYNLASAIIEHRPESALSILKNLFDRKTECDYILRTVASAFIDLERVKNAEIEGVSLSQVAEMLGYGKRAFVLDKMARSAQKITPAQSKGAIKILHHYMMKLKNCEGDDKINTETAVVKLIGMCGV